MKGTKETAPSNDAGRQEEHRATCNTTTPKATVGCNPRTKGRHNIRTSQAACGEVPLRSNQHGQVLPDELVVRLDLQDVLGDPHGVDVPPRVDRGKELSGARALVKQVRAK